MSQSNLRRLLFYEYASQHAYGGYSRGVGALRSFLFFEHCRSSPFSNIVGRLSFRTLSVDFFSLSIGPLSGLFGRSNREEQEMFDDLLWTRIVGTCVTKDRASKGVVSRSRDLSVPTIFIAPDSFDSFIDCTQITRYQHLHAISETVPRP